MAARILDFIDIGSPFLLPAFAAFRSCCAKAALISNISCASAVQFFRSAHHTYSVWKKLSGFADCMAWNIEKGMATRQQEESRLRKAKE